MSGPRSRDQRMFRHLAPVLAAAALIAVSPVAASTSMRASATGAADAKAWCAAVIRINTKYGTMKNKRYVPTEQVSAKTWKAIVDAAVSNRKQLLAITPKEIKKAETDQLAWFARIKANHYSRATPLGSFTVAEVQQLTNFQRTKCGVKFSG